VPERKFLQRIINGPP